MTTAWSNVGRTFVATESYLVGREKVPEGGLIIACKHQSAWDTIAFFCIVDSPVYILKRELLTVPLFGWCLLKSGMIAIDKSRAYFGCRE